MSYWQEPNSKYKRIVSSGNIYLIFLKRNLDFEIYNINDFSLSQHTQILIWIIIKENGKWGTLPPDHHITIAPNKGRIWFDRWN